MVGKKPEPKEERPARCFSIVAYGDGATQVYAAVTMNEGKPMLLHTDGFSLVQSPSKALLRRFLTEIGWIEWESE